MKNLFALFVLLAFCWSCDSTPASSNTGDTINIDVKASGEAVLSRDFTNAEYIVLDDVDVLIGRIKQVRLHDDKLYVLTAGRGHALYQFDLEGKYLGQFGIRGEGPGEYRSMANFAFANDSVYVLDQGAQRLDIYTQEGSFGKTLVNDVYGFSMDMIDEELVVYTGNAALDNDGKAMKLLFYGLDGGLLGSARPMNLRHAEFLNFFPENVMTAPNGLYLEQFSDTIFQIQYQGIRPWKVLDFGAQSFPAAKLDQSYENVAYFVQAVRGKGHAIFYNNLREIKDWVTFTYEYEDVQKPNWALINKQDNQVISYNQFTEDLLTEGTPLTFRQFRMVGTTPDQFIFAVSPNDLLESEKAEKSDEVKLGGNTIIYLLSK